MVHSPQPCLTRNARLRDAGQYWATRHSLSKRVQRSSRPLRLRTRDCDRRGAPSPLLLPLSSWILGGSWPPLAPQSNDSSHAVVETHVNIVVAPRGWPHLAPLSRKLQPETRLYSDSSRAAGPVWFTGKRPPRSPRAACRHADAAHTACWPDGCPLPLFWNLTLQFDIFRGNIKNARRPRLKHSRPGITRG